MSIAARTVLWVFAVVAGLLVIAFAALMLVVGTESGTRWALDRALPIINDSPDMSLSWNNLQGTLLGGLTVDDLVFAQTSTSGGLDVEIERAAFTWQPLTLLDGTLLLDELRIDGLDIMSEDDGSAPAEALTPARLQDMLFGLPLAIELRSLIADGVQLSVNGQPFAFDSLRGSARLDAAGLQLQELEWLQGPTRVTGEAFLDEALDINADIGWQTSAGEQAYAGNLQASGSLQQLALEHALTSPLQVQSTGSVVPAIFDGEILNLDLRHRFDVISLAPYGQPDIELTQGDISTSGSPEALAITGALQSDVDPFDPATLSFDLLYGQNQLALNSVQIDSGQIDLSATGTLTIDPLQLQLDWTLEHLDPGNALPAVQLSDTTGAGSIQLSSDADGIDATIELARLNGLLNDYPLEVNGNLVIIDSVPGDLSLQASNQDNNISVEGTAMPELALDWQVQAPVLAQLWNGLQGELAGQGSITGTIDMPQVNGELNGQQLQFTSEGSSIDIRSLSLQANYDNAANAVALTVSGLGMTDETDGVQTRRPLLQQARLQLNGTPQQHELIANVSSAEGDLSLRVEGAASDNGWQGSLQTASLQSDYGNWQLQNPAPISWLDGAANLGQLCLAHAPVELCAEASRSADGILDADAQLTGLPLTWLNPVAAENGQALTAPSSKPPGLELLQNTYSITLPQGVGILEGDLRADFALRGLSGDTWDSLTLDVQPASIVVQVSQLDADVAEEEAGPLIHRFVFHDANIQAANEMGLWQAAVAFQVTREEENFSVLQGGFEGEGSMDENGNLNGNLAFDFNDAAWLESFVPQLQEPRGSLSGTAMVSGTSSEPLVTSQLHLSDGGVELPEYGLAISDIDLMLQSSGNNDIVLVFSARSGEGSIELSADITSPLLDSRRVSAELRGDNFQIYNASMSRVSITPDLQFQFAEAGLDVRGVVEVPEMNLDLATLLGEVGSNTVTVSRDVVVVRTAEGDETLAGQQGETIPVTANVSLVLGDNVMLRGFGLNADLTGALSLEQSPNRPLLVYGELVIPEGTYEIYNQQLGTRDGRLMFFGNPANPVVDIRAFRETANAEVGMQLSGSLDNMHGELYSTPTLPDNEILALLITGKSFTNVDNQDGDALLGAIANFGFERSEGLANMVSSKLGLDSVTVGSENGALDDSTLGLGKYITPNLLMRYKLGIFDRQSILSIEYNLTERLKLMVETGISQSVDLSYTIERD